MNYPERAAALRDSAFIDRVSQALAQHSMFLLYLTEGPVVTLSNFQQQVEFARQVLDGLTTHSQRIAVWVLAHAAQSALQNVTDLTDEQLLTAVQTVWLKYGQIPEA